MSSSTLFKTDRSHSEVGDTLRYFNSVSASKSWCGDEFYDGQSYFKRQKAKKKSRSNSSSSQYLCSQPAIALSIRNNSVGGCHFDRILDESLLSDSEIEHLTRAIQSHSAPISIKGSQASSREIISIVLHPPDEDLSGEAEEEQLEEVHLLYSGTGNNLAGSESTLCGSNVHSSCPSCHEKGPSSSHESSGSIVLAPCQCPRGESTPETASSFPQITSNPLVLDAIAALKEDSDLRRLSGLSGHGRDDSITTTTIILPAQVMASIRRQDSSRSYFQNRPVLARLLPCVKSPTFEDLTAEDLIEIRLDLGDDDLANTYRDTLAKTKQKYLVMDASTWTDRIVTGSLIIMTMVAILVLFWYQNFGSGFHFSNHA